MLADKPMHSGQFPMIQPNEGDGTPLDGAGN